MVFDEAETLTSSAQLALRAVLEQPATECCILFLVNTLSGIEPSLHHRFLRIRFDPLPSETLAQRIKIYKPEMESPTPLDALRLRGDLRIFLHAPLAAQRLAHIFYGWLNGRELDASYPDRGSIEDLLWLGAVFNVFDLEDITGLTEASHAGVLKVMPVQNQQKQWLHFRQSFLKKLDPLRQF